MTEAGPALEAAVLTENGAYGKNLVMTGRSVATNEPAYLYDGGTRYGGRGVLKAARNVNEIIAPALRGVDVVDQRRIDEIMLSLEERNQGKLGVNSIASVSGAVIKSAADSIGLPLYKYLGGENACVLPVPTIRAFEGSRRYGGGERAVTKPVYDFVCYGFRTLSEAIEAGREVRDEFQKISRNRFHFLKYKDKSVHTSELLRVRLHFPKFVADAVPIFLDMAPKSKVQSDRELWEAMADAISIAGYENRVGIMVDVAAGCYYDNEKDRFVGLFSRKDKTTEDLTDLYEEMCATYPFVILEDPLNEQDYKGHALLTRKLHIEVVGDDLFAMNIKLVQKGIETGACNAMLLRVNQARTISEALYTVQFALRNGYRIMPCGSRGEGRDIVDYAVGLCAGHMKLGSWRDPSIRRLLEIEEELGKSAKFLGREGIAPRRPRLTSLARVCSRYGGAYLHARAPKSTNQDHE